MKALNKILNKYNIQGLSIQDNKKQVSANNRSRVSFLEFCKINGFTRIGANNAFEFNGKIYGYSCVSGDDPECRQFGENYDGLVCEFKSKELKWYDRSQLNVGSVTRIGPDGVKYFNVKGKI